MKKNKLNQVVNLNTKKFRYLLPVFISLFIVGGLKAQVGLPKDGGFESEAASSSLGTVVSTSIWSLSTSTASTSSIINTGARSGSNYLNFGYTGTGTSTCRIQSPGSTIAPGTIYTVQFYYRTAAGVNLKIGESINKPATSGGGNVYTSTALPFSAQSSWTLYTYTFTTATGTSQIDAAGNGWIGFQAGSGASAFGTGTIDIDDFVAYAAGAVDNAAPDPVTSPVDTPASNQIGLSWTAPGTGTDAGGYMVVQYTSDPTGQPEPNVNGVYGVGNTIGTGKVVYLGTNSSYNDNSLSSSATYYYRIYTVDKAFNYSTSVVKSSSTLSTGLNSNAVNSISVYQSEYNVIVKGATAGDIITVHGLNGQSLSRVCATRNQTELNLNQGLYLINVKSNNNSSNFKVIVK